MERCWKDRFLAGELRCPRDGCYGWVNPPPGIGASFCRAARWCEEHRNPQDTLLTDEREENL